MIKKRLKNDIEHYITHITKEVLSNDISLNDVLDEDYHSMNLIKQRNYLRKAYIKLMARSFIGNEPPDYRVGY